MSTFFSSTDIQELQDNAPNHNYYLSLIVNNAFEPTAKIAFVGEQEKKENVVRSFFGDNGRLYKFKNNAVKKEKVLFTYNCKITYDLDIKVSTEFKDRLVEIIEEKEVKRKALAVKNKFTTSKFNQQPKYKTFQGSEDFSEFNEFNNSFNKIENPLDKSVLIEELLCCTLTQEFDAKDNLYEAMFKAAKEYKEIGDDYIAACGSWLRSMGPYMLGYTGEYDLKDKDLEDILKALFFYEDEFEEMVNALADEFINVEETEVIE